MNSYLFKGEFVMIERRNIAVCIVLTLVTCGIYGIYWIVCLTNDVNTVSGDVQHLSDRNCRLYGADGTVVRERSEAMFPAV